MCLVKLGTICILLVPKKSAGWMGDMSGMRLLALFDTTVSVWLEDHVSCASTP